MLKTNPPTTTALVRMKDAAALFGVTPPTLRKYIRHGDIPVRRLSGSRGTYIERHWVDRQLHETHVYDGPGLLTPGAAAAWLGVTTTTLRLAVLQGHIPQGLGAYTPGAFIRELIEGPERPDIDTKN